MQVAAHSLDTGVKGGYYNVCINLESVKDEGYVAATRTQVEEMVQESSASMDRVLDLVKNRKS